MVASEVLDGVARAALRSAQRPPGGDPIVIALELGFEMLPCPAGSSPEYERTSTGRIVFACEAGTEPHAARVRLALARGLLLREGVAHGPDDVTELARRLGSFPEGTRALGSATNFAD